MPFAVCLESLIEIRLAVLEKSPVKDERRVLGQGSYKLVNVYQAWLGPFLCSFHHPVQNLFG